MSTSIVRAFLAHANETGLPIARDAAIKMKQSEIGEIRAARLGSDAIEAARAKDLEHITDAMRVLADAWGKGIEKVDVPESVKVANSELLAWRKTL